MGLPTPDFQSDRQACLVGPCADQVSREGTDAVGSDDDVRFGVLGCRRRSMLVEVVQDFGVGWGGFVS
jgi:hypothetical protein